MTFAQQVIRFHRSLELREELPAGIEVIDPYTADEEALRCLSEFYTKFYSDKNKRRIILGINPGRLGAGVTGVPFTDTKRLSEVCGIDFKGNPSHEPSSVFIYEMINEYGGTEKFYGDFYINSVCPLGFLINKNGKRTNYNYYDSKALTEAVKPFIVKSLRKQVSFGVDTEEAFVLGTGRNYKFFKELNEELNLFKKLTPLEHPRYIVQYKSKNKQEYLDKYLKAFGG